MKFTFAPYIPEDTPKYTYSLELYQFDKWIKIYKRDWLFTYTSEKDTMERRFKYPKDQSQRYWNKFSDLLEMFSMGATTINSISRLFQSSREEYQNCPNYRDCLLEAVRQLMIESCLKPKTDRSEIHFEQKILADQVIPEPLKLGRRRLKLLN